LYFGIFIYLGIENLIELNEYGRQSQKFANLFIYPSIGFGLVIFPKSASELILNQFSYATERLLHQLCAFVGWLLVIYLGCILVL